MKHVQAIVWAQYRVLFNFLTRGAKNVVSTIFTAVFTLGWYGVFAFGAFLLAKIASNPSDVEQMHLILAPLLLLGVIYWQIIPLILVSTGSSLDLKRLLPYPIPVRDLFFLEVVLRLTTGIEILIAVGGVLIGLLLNPNVRLWALLGLIPYMLFNLFLAAGTRELLMRLLSKRRIREVLVLLLVLLSATPQLLLVMGGDKFISKKNFMELVPLWRYWPWTLAGDLALGMFSWDRLAAMIAWVAVAYWFGRTQFESGLRFDQEAAKARPNKDSSEKSRWDGLLSWPSKILPDPLGMLLEKDLRVYARSARFRLVFLMGFTFGILIWFPMALGHDSRADTFMGRHFLAWVSLYAVLLLSEVAFWNVLGFDRGAVQAYYVMPVPLRQVFIAKNMVALLAVSLELFMITMVYLVMRMKVSLPLVCEAITLTLLFALYFSAMGNLNSVMNPRPADPSQSWRNSNQSRGAAYLLLMYPVTMAPVGLAFLGRWAFQSEWGFYGVALVLMVIGAIVYWVSLDSTVQNAFDRRESIVTKMSRGDGPIAA